MKKITLILITAVFVLLVGTAYFFYKNTSDQTQEQVVLKQTYTLSKEYLALRLQTDHVLINAENYPDYASWSAEMTKIIDAWKGLATESQELESSASQTAEKVAVNFTLVKTAHAYSAKEISNVYDKAPRFKGIATLANHLGVDAKKAQAILNQAQAEITSDVFKEEGDAFETLENTATVVKDGCKVVGFVGGVVLTGGTAGLVAAGTVAQVGTVVVGVDLALEVTEDGARIALGDRNKVSSFVKNVRTVTEPIATVITITNVPGNLSTAYGKFDSVMVGLEQFRESAQEGKVVGVDLTNFEYHKPFQVIRKTKYPGTVTVAEMEKAEVEEWLKSLNKEYKPMTAEEAKEFVINESKNNQQQKIVKEPGVTEEESNDTQVDGEAESQESNQAEETESSDIEQITETGTGSVTSQKIAGTYSGSAGLTHIEDDVESPDSLPVILQLNEDGTGTVNVNGYSGEARYAGNSVNFSVTMEEDGAVVNCVFDGRISQNGSQTAINGNMHFSMMGITFASYAWSAQK